MLLKRYKRLGGILSIFFCVTQAVAQNYPAELDLSTLNGKTGFIIPGLNNGDRIGSELDFIGDINNDGLEDLCLGSQYVKPHGNELEGTAYIIFGSRNPFPSSFDLNSLNGANGFKIEGLEEDERRGKSVRGLGDVNGDGKDDMIISTEQNKIMVLYGSDSPFPASMNINYINGSNGFIIDQDGVNEVDGAGDVNGDGINDILVGQFAWSGETYVIFGKNGNFPASISASWLDGTKGFRLSKINNVNISAFFVGPAGDVNNDGYDDIIVGIWSYSHLPDPSKTFVFFGKAGPFSPVIDINNLNGSDGFAITNYVQNAFLKWVGALGDINGDGIDDFYSHQNIIFGSQSPFPAVLTSENTLNGTKGFIIPNVTQSATAAGDLNLDGIDDFIIIGNNQENWVIFGSREPFGASFDPATLDGTNGFRIKNIFQSNVGRQISGGKDFNGDGLSDFIIGSEVTGKGGTAYVVFGGDHIVKPLNTGYPIVTDISYTNATLQINAAETGTVYYAVFPGTISEITSRELIRNSNEAYGRGEIKILNVNSPVNHLISDLYPGFAYDIYLYQEDENGNIGNIYKLDNVTPLKDTEGPSIQCPDKTLTTFETSLPDFTKLITVSDNADDSPSVKQNPKEGASITSEMTVTIDASDRYGNKSTCSFAVSLLTSLKQQAESSIRVFPIPSADIIYIEGINEHSYQILNSLGQLIKAGQNDGLILINTFEDGLYNLLIYSKENELIAQKKIVKH